MSNDNTRQNPTYNRTLSKVSRDGRLAVPTQHTQRKIQQSMQQAQPVFAPQNADDIKLSSAAPVVQAASPQSQKPVTTQSSTPQPAPAKFRPVVEEPKSPIIHMEDLFKMPAAEPVDQEPDEQPEQLQQDQSNDQPGQSDQISDQPSEPDLQQSQLQEATTLETQQIPQQLAVPPVDIDIPYVDPLGFSPFMPNTTAIAGDVQKKEDRLKKNIGKAVKKTAAKVSKIASHPKKALKSVKSKITGKKTKKSAAIQNSLSPVVMPTYETDAAFASFLQPAMAQNPIFDASYAQPQQSNVTEQVLTSASEITQPEPTSTPTPTTVNNYGAVAIATDNGFLNKLSRLSETKITFSVNINKKHVFAIIRTILIVAILTISGYLAYDTWMTNREAQEMFFNKPISSLSINSIATAQEESLDTATVSNQAVSAHTAPADQPRYISIPAININNARVLSVGVNSDGNIDVPKNVNDTAWYDGSAKPGQDGAVFIDGHTSFSRSFTAIFDNLPKLNIGDTITIERGDGKKFTYKIVDKETISRDRVDMNKALSVQGDAKQGLTLMTCTGKYNYATGGAQDRLIIYAVLE